MKWYSNEIRANNEIFYQGIDDREKENKEMWYKRNIGTNEK